MTYSDDTIQKIKDYQDAYSREKEAASEASILEDELHNLGVLAEDFDKDWD
jgi:hypothetical protein